LKSQNPHDTEMQKSPLRIDPGLQQPGKIMQQ